jgi:hypothetical protein
MSPDSNAQPTGFGAALNLFKRPLPLLANVQASDDQPVSRINQTDVLQILPPTLRYTPTQMKAAGVSRLSSLVSNLCSETGRLAVNSTEQLNQNQGKWNTQIIKKLNIKNTLQTKDGLQSFTQEQRAAFQLRALIQPNTIENQVWESIPNKHFESTNFYGEAGVVTDWSDGSSRTPERMGSPHFGFYAGLKDGFRNLKDLLNDRSEGGSLMSEINKLQANGWQMTFSDADLFGTPYLPGPPTPAQYVTVSLSELPNGAKQIEELLALKQKLQENQKKGQAAFEQSWSLGEILRRTKSARDILRDPFYIKDKLLDPILKALKMADPLSIPKILDGFKKEVITLLKDMCGLQDACTGALNASQLQGAEKALAQKVISKILDKITSGLQASSGRQITQEYGGLIGAAESPLGALPGSEQTEQATMAYGKLNPLFERVYAGQVKLTAESIASIIPEIYKETEVQENNLASAKTGSRLDGKTNETPGAFGDILRAQDDPVIEITRCTKEAYEEVFASGRNKDLLNIQLGFVPFEAEPKRQKQLEIILSSERFAGLFKAQQIKTQNNAQSLSVAIMSRIAYLYYRFSAQRDQTSKLQENLAKIDL